MQSYPSHTVLLRLLLIRNHGFLRALLRGTPRRVIDVLQRHPVLRGQCPAIFIFRFQARELLPLAHFDAHRAIGGRATRDARGSAVRS